MLHVDLSVNSGILISVLGRVTHQLLCISQYILMFKGGGAKSLCDKVSRGHELPYLCNTCGTFFKRSGGKRH